MATLDIEINGVVDTGVDVLTNINRIADAALCYVSWDLAIGKWSVIIKELEAPSRSFDDSNIVGAINIGGGGLRETYNSATLRFPHKDYDSESDYVTVEVDPSERYPNELDNELQMSTSLVNDPVHAQYMASLELKNSRLDQIITFSTDFSELGVTAGDVITVTNSVYGFSNKQFRVQRVSERDNTDGSLLIDIVAQEYKDIFSSALSRTDASREGGITPYENCDELQDADKPDPAAMDSNCWCFLGSKTVLNVNITDDTNGLYAEDDWEFWVVPLFDDFTNPNDPPILAGYSSVSFETNSPYLYETGISFRAPKTGRYSIETDIGFSVNLNPEGAGFPRIGAEETRIKVQMLYRINGTLYNDFNSQAVSGIAIGPGATELYKIKNNQNWRGGSGFFNLNENDVIEFVVGGKTDFGPSNPEIYDIVEVALGADVSIYYNTQENINTFNSYFTGP